MIAGDVAECPAGPPPHKLDYRRDENWAANVSNDGTLAWDTQVAADCSRTIVIRTRQGDGMKEVFHRTAPAPQAPAGQAAPNCG